MNKQVKEIFGVEKCTSKNLLNAALFVFNVHKTLFNGKYPLDTWADI